MNHLDTILQTACPTVMVPKFGEFEPLAETGHRFLAAADGLWVEVKRPWLYLTWPAAQQNEFSMPYGTLEKKIELAFSRIPSDLMEQFKVDATAALPNECGAWLVWDEIQKRLKYLSLKAIEAGRGHLRYERPDLEEHESLAVDLHSHGYFKASFSPTDDSDDHGEVKLSGVLGELDSPDPSTLFRVCALGKYIGISKEHPSVPPCPCETECS
jgi:PRTRC genetic system protein A